MVENRKVKKKALEELVVADTLPMSQTNEKIRVLSVAELFAKAIGRIRDHESISSLFIRN